MRSMTGFGLGRAESPLGALSVELRTVNSRFLDLVLRLPAEFSTFESIARAEVQARASRGKVILAVSWTPISGAADNFTINDSLLVMLQRVVRDNGQQPNLDVLMTIPGVVISRVDASRAEEMEEQFLEALRESLTALEKDREREGESLSTALTGFADNMKRCLALIEVARPNVVARYREKLHQRIDELMSAKGGTLDPGRLELEVTLFADKADIEEEVTRLGVHLNRLSELAAPGRTGGTGRQLDFLNQEILREVNTIGSKCRDLDIIQQVLELKNLAEGLKEQLANVE